MSCKCECKCVGVLEVFAKEVLTKEMSLEEILEDRDEAPGLRAVWAQTPFCEGIDVLRGIVSP